MVESQLYPMSFHLSWKFTRDQGAELLLLALAHRNSVTCLDLSCDKIRYQRAERLATALERNKVGVLALALSAQVPMSGILNPDKK